MKQDNLKLKNDTRERQIKIENLNEKLKSKNAKKKKLKTWLKCYKCDLQANTGNTLIIHSLREHSLEN